MTCEKRWDEMRRAEMRWEELTWFEVRWSVKCEVQVWSVDVGFEECNVKCEESLGLALHCAGVARRSFSWTTTLQQLRTKHARTGLAGARCMQVLKMRKVYSISLRQLPSRLVRVPLVIIYIYIYIHILRKPAGKLAGCYSQTKWE